MYFLNNPTTLVAQMVKHLPTMRETRVQFLGKEELLEKEMAPHSSTLPWKIPWTEERVITNRNSGACITVLVRQTSGQENLAVK